jgi:thioredoxin-like negative regulator of GroEL
VQAATGLSDYQNGVVNTPMNETDQRHLDAAQGWRKLNSFVEARGELDQITPGMQSHPRVLEERWLIHAGGYDWPTCLKIAETRVTKFPDDDQAHVDLAASLYSLNRAQDAINHLLPLAKQGKDHVCYELVRYLFRTGQVEEGKDWFCKIKSPEIIAEAFHDRDFKAVWEDGE